MSGSTKESIQPNDLRLKLEEVRLRKGKATLFIQHFSYTRQTQSASHWIK